MFIVSGVRWVGYKFTTVIKQNKNIKQNKIKENLDFIIKPYEKVNIGKIRPHLMSSHRT